MIQCKEKFPTAAGLTPQHKLFLLKNERNEFAKSRQEWIQAAFNLKFHNDDELFLKLVAAELCDNCKNTYEKRSIKTT